MPCSADRFEVTLSDGLGVKKEELDLFLQLFDYIPGFQQQQGLGVSSGCFNTSAIWFPKLRLFSIHMFFWTVFSYFYKSIHLTVSSTKLYTIVNKEVAYTIWSIIYHGIFLLIPSVKKDFLVEKYVVFSYFYKFILPTSSSTKLYTIVQKEVRYTIWTIYIPWYTSTNSSCEERVFRRNIP